MDMFAHAMMQNLPEILARDFAEQNNVSQSSSRTPGRPPVDLVVYESQPPSVPQRNPSRVLHGLHQVEPETFLCSLRQNSVEKAWRSESEVNLKDAACHCSASQAFRQDHTLAPRKFYMNQETEQDARRLFLNGHNEDWGSDSSADARAGLSSPSVRTRKQSVTTAATSVDFQLNSGEKGMDGYPTDACSTRGHLTRDQHWEGQSTGGFYSEDDNSSMHNSENQAAWLARHEGGSWVDLGEHDTSHTRQNESGIDTRRHGRRIEAPLDAWAVRPLPTGQRSDQAGAGEHGFMMEGDYQCVTDEPPVPTPRVPRRRSSLGHQVTTIMMCDAPNMRGNETHNFSKEIASQLLLPSPPASIRHVPSHHHSRNKWNETESAVDPVVPIGHQQAHQVHPDRQHPNLQHPHMQQESLQHRILQHQNLQLDLSTILSDQLLLPPLSATETTHQDRSHNDRSFSLRSQHQQPNLLVKPRKSHSITKMPIRNVQNWLESSSRARQLSPPLISTSPTFMSPSSSVRVSGHVLETLRINVQNFPDTMLRTSSVTIDQIRDYSHKVKRSDTTRQLLPTRDSDEFATAISESSTSPGSPTLGRKTSFGNLKRSFRGKLSRFTNSTSSPSITEQSEADWPPIDDAAAATPSSESSPPQAAAARDAACVNALRSILPHGTPYLLDALYAHVIAYNYIDSVCGCLPQVQPSGEVHHLRSRPSKNVILPAGVTSLADLRVQEDVSDTIVNEFHDDIASIASRTVVPSKAASLLGLGSANMGKPMKPNPGLFGGLDNKPSKSSTNGSSRGHYLESDSAMRSLREDIAHNIDRLVETAQSCSSSVVDTEEAQDGNMVRHEVKQLDPLAMRALSEVVRCYEELSC